MTSILFLLAGAFAAAIVMMVVNQKKTNRMNELNTALSNEKAAAEREATMLNAQLNEARTQHERQVADLKEQAARQMEEQRQRNEKDKEERTQMLDKQFNDRLRLVQEQLRTTTEQLLKQRSEELGKTNRTQIDSILAPMKAVMEEMKKSMDANRESFTTKTASLEAQLKLMHESTATLGVEAERLSKALQTGPKVQGDFGEMKLNDLLDKFGFTKGVEYDVQYTMRDAKGNVIRNDDTDDIMRPDVVLHYPDHKDVVIDSKASLTAFINYVNAETDEERRHWLDEHVRSVHRHVDELAAKSYNKYSMEGGTTLDFVIMFVPQEAAMQLAVSADASLWSYAFDRKVVITGEQNLFSLLRLLQIAWTQQRQTDNQEQVFGLANTLLDRVGLFVERFERIGKNIDVLQKAFDEADKSMNGKLGFIGSARKLVAMGAKENPRRRLPEEEKKE